MTSCNWLRILVCKTPLDLIKCGVKLLYFYWFRETMSWPQCHIRRALPRDLTHSRCSVHVCWLCEWMVKPMNEQESGYMSLQDTGSVVCAFYVLIPHPLLTIIDPTLSPSESRCSPSACDSHFLSFTHQLSIDKCARHHSRGCAIHSLDKKETLPSSCLPSTGAGKRNATHVPPGSSWSGQKKSPVWNTFSPEVKNCNTISSLKWAHHSPFTSHVWESDQLLSPTMLTS